MLGSGRGRGRFWVKPAAAVGLVALADGLLFGHPNGWTWGLFALAALAAAIGVHRPVRRALWPLAAAAVFALILIDAPGPLAWTLFWIALATAVLSPRVAAGADALRWGLRLVYLAAAGVVAPVRDAMRVKARLRIPPKAGLQIVALLALPVLGGALFLLLFAGANPLIAEALGGLSLPALDLRRILFWIVCAVGVWCVLRPRFLGRRWPIDVGATSDPIPGVSVASVGLSLAVFNLLFAAENGLDIAFLWSGEALPEGVKQIDYVHDGAFLLIVTALLAGLFVLVALRPGTAMARSRWLRSLVVLWVAQNLFLVGSSMRRVLNYVADSNLTGMRIAALLWMGLVALGLMLICWRMLRGKSATWLINANALAAGLVLAGCSLVDIDAVAAQWNVDHAREVTGVGAPVDLAYLAARGDAALVPLSELERRLAPKELRASSPDLDTLAQIGCARDQAFANLAARQADWHGWSWRGARRLAQARALALPGVRFKC